VRDVTARHAADARERSADVIASGAIRLDSVHDAVDQRKARLGLACGGRRTEERAERAARRRYTREGAANIERVADLHGRLHVSIRHPSEA
jgi:hypothetical protein